MFLDDHSSSTSSLTTSSSTSSLSSSLAPTSNKKIIKCHLSYQSRVGPVEWLRPYTDHKIEEMGSEGVKNLIVVPISFVSEHIETLDEIDIEYR